mgnify:CR=1 FL=1
MLDVTVTGGHKLTHAFGDTFAIPYGVKRLQGDTNCLGEHKLTHAFGDTFTIPYWVKRLRGDTKCVAHVMTVVPFRNGSIDNKVIEFVAGVIN